MDQEREPGLQPQVHQTENRMDKVEVQMRALPPIQLQPQLARAPLASYMPRAARLRHAENRNQALLDVVLLTHLLNQVVLARGRTAQVDDRPARGLREGARLVPDMRAHLLHVLLEVFPQNLSAPQILLHELSRIQRAQAALQPQPIPSAHYARDFFVMPPYKCFHATAVLLPDFCFHTPTLSLRPSASIPTVAAEPL